MAKPTGAQVVAQALKYAQEKRSYQEMDCQAMIEAAVRACGGKMDYAGSNAMARAVTGLTSLSEAEKAGLQVGMALFIHEDGGTYPEKYHGDGLDNFSHVGLYAGENALTDVDKKGRERTCNVVHSSSSMGRVAGSTLANGWTHAGYFKEIDYGDADTSAGGTADIQQTQGTGAQHTTLRKGSKGTEVRTLQELLNTMAYGLEVDGIFGKATEAAVRGFQQISGLEVDGIVGAKTWAALDSTQESAGSGTYTVTIQGLDAATAAYLLECYPGAAKAEEGLGCPQALPEFSLCRKRVCCLQPDQLVAAAHRHCIGSGAVLFLFATSLRKQEGK
ncbi:MAG: peptidoglycan-binding domain-containing protein [Clostridia bacterium]|nr:peptidoglycan-binding domain-containing protein [Clostridia bacterium]